MDRADLPAAAAESIRAATDAIAPQRLLEVLAIKADTPADVASVRVQADLACSFRRIAGALEHLSAAFPSLRDERSRWMYRVAEQSIREHPKSPDSVSDPRTRSSMLAENLGDRFADYALPEAERKAKWAAEKAAREAANAAGSMSGGGEEPRSEGGF